MTETNGLGRRQFLKSTTAAAAVSGAPAILAQRNPNSVLGIASIGVGTRGIYLHQQVQECPNTEVRIICDLYDANIERARKQNRHAGVKIMKDWEKAVTSPDIDAVLIATPDFWHAKQAILAAENKKHIYVEKGMCRTLDEAKGIRDAVQKNGVVLQLGHHQNSDPYYTKAREIFQSGQLGKVPLARTYIDRTNPWPEWQFYTAYNIQKTPEDANEQTIDWQRFIANAPKRPFDVQRFFRWRCWWEYGTGIAGDLMSHQVDGINMIMGMGIPEACQVQGGLYFWKEDREVPDMWHALLEYPKKDLAVTFACSFHNRHHGTNTYILGRDASIEVSGEFCKVYGAEWKPEHGAKMAKARREAAAAGRNPRDVQVPPDYEMKPGELKLTSHMRDFIDCIRSGQKPRCDMKQAFEEAVTIVMAVEAFKRERKVRWDPVKEQII